MVTLTNLFKTIDEKGLTKSKVAKDTGISSGNISDWQNGRSMPTAVKLDVLADYLGVSVDYLLGRTDEPCRTVSNSVVNEQHNVSIGGDNVQSISGTISQRDTELLDKINSLNFDDYADIISYINAKVKSARQT